MQEAFKVTILLPLLLATPLRQLFGEKKYLKRNGSVMLLCLLQLCKAQLGYGPVPGCICSVITL